MPDPFDPNQIGQGEQGGVNDGRRGRMARLMVIGNHSRQELPDVAGKTVQKVLEAAGIHDLTGQFIKINGQREDPSYVLEGGELIQVSHQPEGN